MLEDAANMWTAKGCCSHVDCIQQNTYTFLWKIAKICIWPNQLKYWHGMIKDATDMRTDRGYCGQSEAVGTETVDYSNTNKITFLRTCKPVED